MRKITIPYGNFMSNSQISASQMNLNFDEIEHVFNDLFEDYIEHKRFIETEYIDSSTIKHLYETFMIPDDVIDVVIGEYVTLDYSTGYATGSEILNIIEEGADGKAFGEIIEDGIRACFITEGEILSIVRGEENA